MDDSIQETSIKCHGVRVKNVIITHLRRAQLSRKIDISNVLQNVAQAVRVQVKTLKYYI